MKKRFNRGDIVIFTGIDINGDFTKNKSYSILEVELTEGTSNIISILDNHNFKHLMIYKNYKKDSDFLADNFIPLKEYRRNKIEKILWN